MPQTGIEPVREDKSRRILSPVRLPVPPLLRMDGGGFEPPTELLTDLQSDPFDHSRIHSYISDNTDNIVSILYIYTILKKETQGKISLRFSFALFPFCLYRSFQDFPCFNPIDQFPYLSDYLFIWNRD